MSWPPRRTPNQILDLANKLLFFWYDPLTYRLRCNLTCHCCHPSLSYQLQFLRPFHYLTRKMEALNAKEQAELQSIMEKKQIKDFMTMYSKLVQNCFDACVNDFTSKTLHSREENCVMRCIDKHQKSNERLSLRFQEKNTELMQSGQIPGR